MRSSGELFLGEAAGACDPGEGLGDAPTRAAILEHLGVSGQSTAPEPPDVYGIWVCDERPGDRPGVVPVRHYYRADLTDLVI